jgi:hypothetical protein
VNYFSGAMGAMPTPAPQRMVLANWHRAGVGMPISQARPKMNPLHRPPDAAEIILLGTIATTISEGLGLAPIVKSFAR